MGRDHQQRIHESLMQEFAMPENQMESVDEDKPVR